LRQDTFYVGTLKGVGRIYQQTVIDTYAKVAFAKLYDRKTPITATEILNDQVVPFFDEHGIPLSRVLTGVVEVDETEIACHSLAVGQLTWLRDQVRPQAESATAEGDGGS
jgi:hypothetical protein